MPEGGGRRGRGGWGCVYSMSPGLWRGLEGGTAEALRCLGVGSEAERLQLQGSAGSGGQTVEAAAAERLEE